MSWKNRATPVNTEAQQAPQGTGSWKDRAKALPPEVSQLESFGRGVLSGVSLGFADEATGALEAAVDWIKNDPDSFMENYKQRRDESRANYKAAQEANPVTYGAGQVAGAIAPALLTAGGSTAATAASLAAQGAGQGLGSSEADLTEGDVGGALRDTAIGGGIGLATAGASKLLNKIPVKKIAEKTSQYLGKGAEKLAENATGATAKQAANFSDDAGRQLLDRGLVKFGDTADDIAQRVGSAKSAAGKEIGESLAQLDAKGVTSSVDNVVAQLEQQIDELSRVPGNEKIVRQLQGEVDNLYNRGVSNMPVSEGELSKRAFHGQVNTFSPEAEKKAAGYVGDAFMSESERAAVAADPSIAQKFIKGKQDYKLFTPIEEAAERRAAQQAQSPFGGFSDLVAGVGGLATGGLVGAAAGIIGKRVVTPRLASSSAVIADYLAKVVKESPQMLGKFAKPLQDAAARGGTSLAATHYVLQQTNPEYRDLVTKSQEDRDEKEE